MKNCLRVCALGSGSGGNAVLIEFNRQSVIIDAGFSCKALLEKMRSRSFDPGNLSAVLLSHEHEDHIRGGKTFCDKLSIPLFASSKTALFLSRKNKLPSRVCEFEIGNAFELGPFEVHPFAVQHDACDPAGFSIRCGSFRVGIATDLGQVTTLAARHLGNSDVLVLESNYDEEILLNSSRPLHLKRRILGKHGHLDNLDSIHAFADLLSERTRFLALAHISGECNDREKLRAMAEAELRRLGREDIALELLKQDEPGDVFELEDE